MRTRIFVISPDSGITPEELVIKITSRGFKGIVKETCFGAIVEGEEDEVSKLTEYIREYFQFAVFSKERGYPVGDKRICRAERGGGPRPGLYQIQYEAELLPLIASALRELGVKPNNTVKSPKKVLIFPLNSLILADLIERAGHIPLTAMSAVGKLVRDPLLDSPPRNITSEHVTRGLKYLSVEMPSGIRGRLGAFDELIEEAQGAILCNYDLSFGCDGCQHINSLIYIVKSMGIPHIRLSLPRNLEESKGFVKNILEFLSDL
ncbi:MAG: methanogenesis marker 5 protein [Candidatus Korarchaeum sp.]|nr:methanogenesis marker 5 protein [Candidatus Korarchaeum sp.]